MSVNPDQVPESSKIEAPESEAVAGKAVPLEDQRDEDIDDGLLDPEAIIEARPEWGDINTASNAASMDAPVPAPMAAAHVNMFWNAEINGLGSITDGSGTLKNAFEQMFGLVDENGRKKDDDDDGWGDYADAHERRAEARREMEEAWNHSEHEYAGVTMTGEQWGRLATALSKGGKLRPWLLSQIKKDGATDAEAESLADKVALRTKMNDTPPELWTDDMKALDRDMQADPALKTKIDGYVAMSAKQASHSYSAPNATATTSMSAGRDVSMASRADAFDTPLSVTTKVADYAPASSVTPSTPKQDFPTAPDLQAHHEAALAATSPLDGERASTVAAVAPTPAPGSGFDV